MNFTRKPLASREERENASKKFHLSLKKPRDRDLNKESAKENNPRMANANFDVYNYRNAANCVSDGSISDSQNYNLRLSDSADENVDEKRLPCYYRGDNSRRVKQNTEDTVLVSESTSSSSSDSSRRYGDKKSRIYTPFYKSKKKNKDSSLDIIVLETSESDDEILETKKQSGGLISLDSDDDSVLKTLKIDSRKSVDNVKNKNRLEEKGKDNRRYETAENYLTSFASKSTSKILTGCNRRGVKSPQSNRRNRSDNSSSGSSSTRFSPSADIVLGSDLSNEFRITSESSSRNDTAPRKQPSGEKIGKNLSERYKKPAVNDNSIVNTPGDRNFANVTCRSTSRSGIGMKSYDSVSLTKKDAQRIIRGVKIAGGSHWTPKLDSPYLKCEIESLSQDYKNDDEKIGVLINETESELLMSDSSSDDDVIVKSTKTFKPSKTHVSRFMNTPNQDQGIVGLSENKKAEISNWLMNNTPGSSSSSSIVSESNRNSSFGNSSLERFELNHETPNNRGKISKPGTSEKPNSVSSATDRFIYKGKSSVVKNQTPVGACNSENMKIDTNQIMTPTSMWKPTKRREEKSLPKITAVENLDMNDCADILDKLYGNVWRRKANAVFTPSTEPRPQKNIKNNGQSQTERKPKPKSIKGEKIIISSSEDEDEFSAFKKNIKPNFNSTKKKLSRESFITDKSPSENSSESFYYTALTNPRESKDTFQPPKAAPVSALTKRAVAICDSDSDSDSNPHPSLLGDLNRKRLSFSEDSSDTSTSEFDPGEVVLPKPKAKKAPVKKHQQTLKPVDNYSVAKISVNSDKKTRSFLASLSATVPIQSCHPEAKIYRDNYKNKKEDLCKYLFKLYNKEVFEGKLPNDMPIEWNVRMRGTAGFCYNKKSVKALGGIVRSSRIVLATKILDTPDRLRDTLVHEMCHAAAWLINNVSDGHGPYWKGWASKAMKKFPELPPIKRCHDYKIKTKFTYKCMTCGYSIGRHSKSLNVERKRCGLCFGKFELLINRTTRSGTTQVATPVQTRTPTGFALFVKENYHSVKKDRRSIKHGEVMKILGQQFSAVKIAKKPTNSDLRT